MGIRCMAPRFATATISRLRRIAVLRSTTTAAAISITCCSTGPGTGTISILANDGGTFSPVYQGAPGTGIGGYDLMDAADRAMATNYPIVRLQYPNGRVVYCRTGGHSTMGVATGARIVSTSFTVPPGAPDGGANLVVVANGIASDPVPVVVGP